MLVHFSSCLSPDVWQVVTRSTLCENSESGHCLSQQWTRFPSLFIFTWTSSWGKQEWDRRPWGKQIVQGELNSGLNNKYIFKNLYFKKISQTQVPFHLLWGFYITRKQKIHNTWNSAEPQIAWTFLEITRDCPPLTLSVLAILQRADSLHRKSPFSTRGGHFSLAGMDCLLGRIEIFFGKPCTSWITGFVQLRSFCKTWMEL